MPSFWIFAGSISALISVAMGAFGAHALSDSLSAKSLSVYQTAAQYQMYHSLALIVVGLLASRQTATSLAGWTFLLGIILFSGSLYALAITDIKILGAITPLGGLSFMIGWAALAFSVWGGLRIGKS